MFDARMLDYRYRHDISECKPKQLDFESEGFGLSPVWELLKEVDPVDRDMLGTGQALLQRRGSQLEAPRIQDHLGIFRERERNPDGAPPINI